MFKTSAYYFLAFAISAAVTYILPGTGNDEAFVDIMSIFISLAFFCFGTTYAIWGMIEDYENRTR